MSEVKEQLLQKNLLAKAKRSEFQQEGDLTVGHNQIRKGDLTVKIADIWGFCYGVLYAIEAVGEVLEEHPDEKVWVLGELIHNDHVNDELRDLGAHFIEPDEVHRADPDDIVVVPAFGTKKEVFEYLDESNVETVDTTCPEVREVEEEVLDFNEDNLTTIIHGKHEHEESIATGSFANQHLIVRDREETRKVCDYIRNGGDADSFLEEFGPACSEDFDPDRDLEKIGLANQTTMLMDESMAIFEMIEQAVNDRDGHTRNVRTIDTICSATQDRQDAVQMLTKTNDFDLFLVIGGHQSSNTKSLTQTVVGNGSTTAYHIQDQSAFDRRTIRHLPHDSHTPETTQNWLPEGPVTLGITAGASTPHSDIEEILEKLISFY